jgi:hypothetical protein
MADLIDDADIDFDRAASAFPDISLDGEGDIPFNTPPTLTPAPAGPFDLDAFGGPTPTREVRVTGHDDSDDEIGKFESEFPELEVPQVRCETYLRAYAVPVPASRRTRPEY